MPELPEVEIVKRGLEKLIVGKTFAKVDYNWPKSFPNSPQDVKQFLLNSKITIIKRRAKVLIIDLDSEYSLAIHLKMTGQLVYVGNKRFGAGHPTDSLVGKLPDKSTRITFIFKDKSRLFFNDQRKFGWVRLLPTIEVSNLDFFKRVGPEPLAQDFKAKDFIKQFRKRNNSVIKAALLDQTVIAGVGNIYADESLWAAKIHPSVKVKDISDAKMSKLFIHLQQVLQLGINEGGSTDRNYVNAEGKKGSYIKIAKVFRRENKACYRCGSTITKIRVAGRGTHICPKCQIAA